MNYNFHFTSYAVTARALHLACVLLTQRKHYFFPNLFKEAGIERGAIFPHIENWRMTKLEGNIFPHPLKVLQQTWAQEKSLLLWYYPASLPPPPIKEILLRASVYWRGFSWVCEKICKGLLWKNNKKNPKHFLKMEELCERQDSKSDLAVSTVFSHISTAPGRQRNHSLWSLITCRIDTPGLETKL